MLEINLNMEPYISKSQTSILEVCKLAGIQIPRFCYHELLSVAGNCRMCFVEINGMEKPIASCVSEIENNMSIRINTPFIKKARENVIEMLLINHPLDCPICDQGGECDLQDETKEFSSDYSRYFFNKREVEDKNYGNLIKTVMTRCIHCTRCVRYFSDVIGSMSFGTMGRGRKTEIGGYFSKSFHSFLSGNVTDLCPVGALTSNKSAFKARIWELEQIENIDLSDGNGTNICFEISNGDTIHRILSRSSSLNTIENNMLSDRTRYGYDYIEEVKQYTHNYNYELKFKLSISQTNKYKDRHLIIVDEYIDLETLLYLQLLKKMNPDKITIRAVRSYCKSDEQVINFDNSKFIDQTKGVCVLISLDPKLETPLLYVKLQKLVKDDNLKIFQIGPIFESDFPIYHLSNNLSDGIQIIENSFSKPYKYIKESQSPTFILGDSINLYTNKVNALGLYIKKLFPSSTVIKVRNKPNAEAIYRFNICQMLPTDFIDKDFVWALNLHENLEVRNLLIMQRPYNMELIWINSFTYPMEKKLESVHIIRPLLPYFCKEYYMNQNGLVQRTIPLKSGPTNQLSMFETIKMELPLEKNIVHDYFKIGDGSLFLKNYYYYADYSNNNEKRPIEHYNMLSQFNKYTKDLVHLSKVDIKVSSEDYYLYGRFGVFSKNMKQSSKQTREEKKNFIDFRNFQSIEDL